MLSENKQQEQAAFVIGREGGSAKDRYAQRLRAYAQCEFLHQRSLVDRLVKLRGQQSTKATCSLCVWGSFRVQGMVDHVGRVHGRSTF